MSRNAQPLPSLLLNSTQVRQLLSIEPGKPLSRYKLWKEIKEGRLRAKRAPGLKARLIFTVKEVERYIEQGLEDVGPAPAPPANVTPIKSRRARRAESMQPGRAGR
jgi:hypothetical protein